MATQERASIEDRFGTHGGLFQLLTENVKDFAIFIVDEQQRITTWSVGAECLLGYASSEVLGEPLEIIFTPEDRAAGAPQREVRMALEQGRGEDERWHQRKDGSRFWASGVLTPLRDRAGRLHGFAKIMRDVTGKKLTEDKLAASEARFRRLLEANIIGIGVTRADGRILDANDEYLRIIGHTREELKAGQVFWSTLTPPEYLPLDEAAIAQAIRDGACVPYEKEYERHSDHRRVPIQIAFAALQEPAHSFMAYVVDLTNFKHAQEELRQANRNKDEFLAMLGHELRNPLAPMLNAVHILRHARRTHDEAVANHSMHMLERQVGHMTRLVDDLLEVARVTLGKVEIRRHALELHPVVSSAIETVRPLMEARRHQLHLDIEAEPIWLDADPMRVEQILTNLLTNAAKYTDVGGSIWLEVKRENGMAVIRVRDTGIGIHADSLPHVFEPFTQVERGRLHAQGGLGVGLALVRRFAELHGGTASAFSAGHGRGSTFTVTLPMMSDAPPPRQDASRSEEPGVSSRVLVVDDNIDAADSLRMILELSGHEVQLAHTGPTALDMTRSWTPDVVLLDIGLPGMDGYQVAEAIRNEQRTRGTFLVAMTGYGHPSDVQRAHAAGFDQHLVKPVEPEMVLDAIRFAAQR